MHDQTSAKGTILLTGGAGFFGSILKQELVQKGYTCVSIDLQKDDFKHPLFTAIQGDIRNREGLEQLFSEHHFTGVVHCAAILAHAVKDTTFLWESNVNGTKNVADCCQKFGVKNIVFTSTNCLWAEDLGHPVQEDERPNPVEIYGKSKAEAEKILLTHTALNAVIIRCPTIIDSGRLGLLAILFEFIDEGRKVWVVGGGDNVYQFIYAQDLADAIMRALTFDHATVFNIGSDDVKSFRDVYNSIIRRANTGSRVASIPRWFAIPAMKISYALGISPLGPYQYKMIASNFLFDTTKIKRELGWKPTMSNEDMLWKAYEYYHRNRDEIEGRTDVSAHKQAAKMGVIRLLKWLS